MTTTAKGNWLRTEAFRRGHVRVDVVRGKSGAMFVPAEIEGREARLAIGDFQVGRTEMGIMDLAGVNAQLESVGDGAADGVVGSDLMARHGAIVDVAGKALYLELAAEGDGR